MLHIILISTLLGVSRSTEYIPERYLRPRNFNHHPFTDVGVPPIKSQLRPYDEHPYALLVSQRPREGRKFPDNGPILYPNPPQEILPKPSSVPSPHHPSSPIAHQLQPQHDPYVNIPKNYAFSYTVKDQHSGDDFSHSQAHNGKATRGQYRVKLPDGRIQIVSYTADHKGYRAEVTYEEQNLQPSAPVIPPTPSFPAYPSPTPGYISPYYSEPQTVPYQSYHQVYPPTPQPTLYTPTPYDEQPSPFSVQPYLRSTPAPFARHFVTTTERPVAIVTPRGIFNAALESRGFGNKLVNFVNQK